MAQCELYDSCALMLHNTETSVKIKAMCFEELPDHYFSYQKASILFSNGGLDHQLGGFINIGYNCYMNSVLQCLMYTPGFPQFCLSLPNVLYMKNESKPFFLDAFAHVFSELEKNRSICPSWFLNDAGSINDTFRKPIQQDAHEFLLSLLETMEIECKSALNPNDNQNDTLVSHFFAGKHVNTIECSKCHHSSMNQARFFDITVPFYTYDDLQQAISVLTCKREISINNTCMQCQNTECTKSTETTCFPLILMITMLRFNNNLKKLEDFFKYQDTLVVGDDNLEYSLYSMIVHEGRFISHGHFIAYVRDSNNIWYKADDVCVYRVKDDVVMNLCPYVLFYKRVFH